MTKATGDMRNIALVGHAGAGKTLLAEALLFGAGSTRAKGSLARGSTVCDHDPQARRLLHSIDATLCWLETGGAHVNLADTPGYPDFIGRTLPVLEAVETAAVLADGLVVVRGEDGAPSAYSTANTCPDGHGDFPELEPRLFSFNSPHGACAACDGLGERRQPDPRRVVKDGVLYDVDALLAGPARPAPSAR